MGFEGIDSTHFDILTNTCAYTTTTTNGVTTTTGVTITVGDGEFAYVFYRKTDSNVVVNAYNAAGTECVFPATAKIAVSAAAGGASNATHKILFDFLSGTYAPGVTGTNGEGISVTFATGQTNLVEIRGTAGIDLVTFGSAASGSPLPSYASYALNGAATHAWTDMVMSGVTDVLVSTGPGDDIITGQGNVGSAAKPLSGNISMTVYGGDGNDTITSGAGGGTAVNSLNGNAGSDRFPQVAGVLAHDIISGGSDLPYTYPQTTVTSTSTSTFTTHLTATGTNTLTNTATASAVRTLTTTNSATATYTFTQTDISVDVVDYSARTSAIRVTLGDEAAPVTASGSISFALPSTIADHDGFTLNDGSTTQTYEYHSSKNAVTTGTITFAKPARGTNAMTNLDQFTFDDGVNTATTFELMTTTTTPTLAAQFVIDLTTVTSAIDVASQVASAIATYQATATPATTLNVSTSVNGATITVTNNNPNKVTTFIAKASGPTGDATIVNTPGTYWVATANTRIVTINNVVGGAAGVATATVDEINLGSTGVTATASGSVVTVTAKTAGAAGNATLAPKSGSAGFTTSAANSTLNIITNLFAGVAKAGANDGDFTGNVSEADSIGADVEMVIGSSKDDYIDATLATATSHILEGMSGNDSLIIGVLSTVPNTLYGGPGDDILQGGSGVDTLYGGDGNDSLRGGPGNDVIDGANVNCKALVTPVAYTATTPAVAAIYTSSLCTSAFLAASTTIIGKDTLDYSDRTASVIVDMTTLASPTKTTVIGVGTEQDSVTNCINLRGGSGADTLTGDANSNMIWGGLGDDIISGGPGNDTLYGEAGDDTISGDAGDDYIYGGKGSNTIFGDTSGSSTITGNDLIDNSDGSGPVDCGPGDMDILIGGTDVGTTPDTKTCEM
jgi:Ca2+-binding RTX toxin-like protein